MSQIRVNPQQVVDWSDNPTTKALLNLIQEEIKEIQETSVTDCFFPGEPQKTQENLIELEARLNTWESLVEFLEGDWSYFEEIEDE